VLLPFQLVCGCGTLLMSCRCMRRRSAETVLLLLLQCWWLCAIQRRPRSVQQGVHVCLQAGERVQGAVQQRAVLLPLLPELRLQRVQHSKQRMAVPWLLLLLLPLPLLRVRLRGCPRRLQAASAFAGHRRAGLQDTLHACRRAAP
jgi:hypothetical protein